MVQEEALQFIKQYEDLKTRIHIQSGKAAYF